MNEDVREGIIPLGSDWRETDEAADEQSEVNAVAKR